ncbi:MAG: hypothetical protein ACXVKO_12335 [Bacteriovorax sp.]
MKTIIVLFFIFFPIISYSIKIGQSVTIKPKEYLIDPFLLQTSGFEAHGSALQAKS